jgi:hypothetical protein
MRTKAMLIAAMLAVAACGGSSATGAPAATPAGTPAAIATTAPAATETVETTEAPEATEAPASLVPGSIAYRVVNLAASPVDVFVRTQGLVHAFPAAAALAPGAVTEDLFPPEPGGVVVLPSGGASALKDATCVMDCTFLGESSTTAGEGDRRLLVVRSDGATEYWEHPSAASVGTAANALLPADPASALLIAEAQGVTDATFGLRVAVAGTAGCQADTSGNAFLLGGTVVLAYAMDPAGGQVTLHGNNDQECAEAPVGGPFPVTGTIGSRSLLLLWGTMGAMQGLVVPLP